MTDTSQTQKKHFVSAGWPYLYDIPGLHNCVPMLFADVYARFYRLNGDDVFFLCGADEHGARTEYVANGYGTTPQELLDSKFIATVPLLEKLELSFDMFGRTGDPHHKQFVQEFIQDLASHDYLTEGFQKVAWCQNCTRHLPDRFLEGTCPYCASRTYGNQCNNKKDCSRLVEADKVLDGRCAICAHPIEWKEEPHLFLKLEQFKSKVLNNSISPAKDIKEVFQRIDRTFAENATVCLTRDTNWGITLPGLSSKTVYSWVDSLLAKVSMLKKKGPEYEARFWKDPETQHHFFLGMDGSPFYGALFPSLLLGSNRDYAIDHWNIFPNEVFIYEGGICSKSTGTGIWLEEALSTLPADFWRFYIFFVHASVETGAERDVDFRWDRFCSAVNQWVIQGFKEAVLAPPGRSGEAEETAVKALLEESKIGEAFLLLLTSIVGTPSAEKTQRLAPLLSCFMPNSGEKLLRGEVPFDISPLYAPQVQMDYQDLVDARRAKRGVMEEVIDARSDALCVCPINLKEQ